MILYSFLYIIVHKSLVTTILKRKQWRLHIVCSHAFLVIRQMVSAVEKQKPVTHCCLFSSVGLSSSRESEDRPPAPSGFLLCTYHLLSLHVPRSNCKTGEKKSHRFWSVEGKKIHSIRNKLKNVPLFVTESLYWVGGSEFYSAWDSIAVLNHLCQNQLGV